MLLVSNPRYTMFNHPSNPRKIEFDEYDSDPQLMIERQIEHLHWVRHFLPQDAEMGPPKDGWNIYVDMQNTYDAAWLGGEMKYYQGQVPDVAPWLSDDKKRSLFDTGIPDPFTGGAMAKMWNFYDYMVAKKDEGWTYKGHPIAAVVPSGMGFDGTLTVACNIRGTSEFMADLIEDPDYAQELMGFITEAGITRLSAYREKLGRLVKQENGSLADDSIQLISTKMYKEAVMPHHTKLLGAFDNTGPNSIHLCGDSTRHFSTIRDELNVMSFDTGYPVDFKWLRGSVGPDVQIYGGPSVPFLECATPDEVTDEVERILCSGIMEGGRFVLREGNNLGPGVSLENAWAMYDAGKKFGVYQN